MFCLKKFEQEFISLRSKITRFFEERVIDVYTTSGESSSHIM